jgi:hypothetical protein
MEAALLEAVAGGAPLLRVLAGRTLEAARALERDLLRAGEVALETVEPEPALCALVPQGMCERLLAVPVGRDAVSGTVDLAVADPFDPHVREEFAYQLGAPVRALQAPLSELLAELEVLGPSLRRGRSPADETFDDRTPAFGTARLPDLLGTDRMPSAGRLGRKRATGSRGVANRTVSEPPIPLVRRSLAPAAPAAEREPSDERGQINRRPKDIETVLGEMQEATGPADVARLLADGLEAVARMVVVFSLRGKMLHGRAGSLAVGASQAIARWQLDPTRGGVLAQALEAGHYLGPLLGVGADSELEALFAGDTEEVYAGRVDVSARPTLVFVLGSMTNAFLASQRADRLARAACAALERIVVAKKSRRPGR